MKNTIKAYYKACTTKKKYIIVEDISTNYFCYKYTATNDYSKWENDSSFNTTIISTEYYYENLDVLQYLFKEMVQSWTQYCYELEWEYFLSRYELTQYQYNKINKLLKD
jgi:hypothetical protein